MRCYVVVREFVCYEHTTRTHAAWSGCPMMMHQHSDSQLYRLQSLPVNWIHSAKTPNSIGRTWAVYNNHSLIQIYCTSTGCRYFIKHHFQNQGNKKEFIQAMQAWQQMWTFLFDCINSQQQYWVQVLLLDVNLLITNSTPMSWGVILLVTNTWHLECAACSREFHSTFLWRRHSNLLHAHLLKRIYHETSTM